MKKKKVTKAELLESILAGMNKQEMVDKFRFKSMQSFGYYLYKYFNTSDLLEIKRAAEREDRQPALEELEPQFVNPIAGYNLETGEGFSRIDEIWGAV